MGRWKITGAGLKGLLYIAETDGNGMIVALWRAGPDQPVPRPVVDAAAELAELDAAEVSGATHAVIRAFLLTQRG